MLPDDQEVKAGRDEQINLVDEDVDGLPGWNSGRVCSGAGGHASSRPGDTDAPVTLRILSR